MELLSLQPLWVIRGTNCLCCRYGYPSWLCRVREEKSCVHHAVHCPVCAAIHSLSRSHLRSFPLTLHWTEVKKSMRSKAMYKWSWQSTRYGLDWGHFWISGPSGWTAENTVLVGCISHWCNQSVPNPQTNSAYYNYSLPLKSEKNLILYCNPRSIPYRSSKTAGQPSKPVELGVLQQGKTRLFCLFPQPWPNINQSLIFPCIEVDNVALSCTKRRSHISKMFPASLRTNRSD